MTIWAIIGGGSVPSRIRIPVLMVLAVSVMLMLFQSTHDPGGGVHAQATSMQILVNDLRILKTFYEATDGDNWDDEATRTSWQGVRDLDLSTLPATGSFTISPAPSGITLSQSPAQGPQYSVVELVLRELGLTGSIPLELGSMTALNELNLSDNNLTGPIPPELGDLTTLLSLSLSDNNLTGSIPPELGDLAALRLTLDLSGNNLTGSIPPELGSLTAMTALDLAGNNLTGSIPPELGSLTALGALDLSGNNLTGSIPPGLSSLTALRFLDLSDNNLRGRIPDLSVLTGLVRVILSHNRLTGGIPPLAESENIEVLDLRHNQLTGEIPSDLLATSPGVGRFLYLQSNRLTGEIPSSLDNKGLNALYLHDNEFTGEVPDLNGNSALSEIGLGGNNLDLSWATFGSGGNLDLSANTILKSLYLHDSGLIGEIPAWIQNTKLEFLHLQGNELMGEIPDLSALGFTAESGDEVVVGLTELGLGDGLTGELPEWLNGDDIPVITRLYLHGNDLTGNWEFTDTMTMLEAISMSRGSVFSSGLHVWLGSSPAYLVLPPGSSPTGSDGIKSKVMWKRVSLDADDVHVRPHPRIARVTEVIEESVVDIALEHRDADGDPLSGQLSPPAVVCVPIPSSYSGSELRLLKQEDSGSAYRYLEPADPPSGYNPGDGNVALCGLTNSFSQFVAATVELATGGTGVIERISRISRISRIEPSVRSVTVSAGDVLRLNFDVYGRQNILDNDLAADYNFAWSDGNSGGEFRSAGQPNGIVYTVPTSPGKYEVTATSPVGACLSGDDPDDMAARCTAKFTINVRRPSATSQERPAPENPIGEIPAVLVDAEGRQHEVFTPEGGGSFDGGDVTISAEPGVVPNLEIVGVRADSAGSASNVGMTGQRYTLSGQWFEVSAVDADGAPLSSYTLNAPMNVCLPTPPELLTNISNLAMASVNADESLTLLSGSVRITTSGIRVCADLSTLPATVAVGRPGSPADLPTPTPELEPAEPDTGGSAPSAGLLVLLTLLGVSALAVPIAVRWRAG